MVKGGILRLGVPDFEKICQLYLEGWDLKSFLVIALLRVDGM